MHACTAHRKLLQSWQKAFVVKQKQKLLQAQDLKRWAAPRQYFQAIASRFEITLDFQLLMPMHQSQGWLADTVTYYCLRDAQLVTQ